VHIAPHVANCVFQECNKLIAREKDTVFKSANWKKLEKANPTLTIQLAIAACLQMK
jgi:hypothetical protein